eukprot:1787259-Karenia_brevis.AAC.1
MCIRDRINIHTYDEQRYKMLAEPELGIRQLRTQIEKETGTQGKKQTLRWKKTQLQDFHEDGFEATIRSYGIQSDDTLKQTCEAQDEEEYVNVQWGNEQQGIE